jgi:hypothetical protein
MPALNVITGRVTNPGTTLTALTMNTGDSTTVKSFPFGSQARILQAWGQTATAGVLRVRSPRLHDVNQGIRLRTSTTVSRPLIPQYTDQVLVPQDVLTFEGSGGGAEVDVFSILLYYPDLPGISAHLISAQEVESRTVNLAGMEVTVTSSATAGQYGGSTNLNATFDNWKRNVDYAILGVLSDTAGCTIGITGPDTGQTRVGLPMAVDPLVGYQWFVDLSQNESLPLIPVINAANIGATQIDVATTSVGATVNLSVIVAELSGAGNAQFV